MEKCEHHDAMEASIERLRANQGETYGLIRTLTDRVADLTAAQAALKATSEAGFEMVGMRFEYLAGGIDRLEAAIAAKPQPAPSPVPQRRARWSPKTWAVLITAVLGSTGIAAWVPALIQNVAKPGH